MNSSVLITPGGSRRELTLREQRLLRLKPPQEKAAMSRTRPRTITIRMCSMDRAVAAGLWTMLAGLAGWTLYETHENSKAIAVLIERVDGRERTNSAGSQEKYR